MEAETEIEAPAIKALGSLFKLTQVFLWDNDVYTEEDGARNNNTSESINFNRTFAAKSSRLDLSFNEYALSLEDTDLNQQMNTLGLPVSFGTSKKTAVVKKAKRKGNREVKLQSDHEKDDDTATKVSRAKDGQIPSPINSSDNGNASLCCKSTLSHCETTYCDHADKVSEPQVLFRDGSLVDIMTKICSAACPKGDCEEISGIEASCGVDHISVPDSIISNGIKEVAAGPIDSDYGSSPETVQQEGSTDKQLVNYRGSASLFVAYYDSEADKLCVDITTEPPCVSSSVASVLQGPFLKDEHGSCEQYEDFGEWRAFWDDFYMRNYFYNIKTHESTWYPPPGFEHLATSGSKIEPSDMVVDAAKGDVFPVFPTDEIKVQDPCDVQDNIHLFEDVTGDYDLLGNSSHEISSRIEFDTERFISSLVMPEVNHGYEHLPERDGVIVCSGNKKNSDEETPSISISEKQCHVDSLDTELGCLDTEEVWRNDPPLTCVNSKTGDLDVYDHFDLQENVISPQDTHNICDDSTIQVLGADSLATTSVRVDPEENGKDMQLEYMTGSVDELNGQHDPAPGKKKKKIRRTRAQRRILSDDNQGLLLYGMPEEFSDSIAKYWCQRYSLFSKFDDGIKMDEEGWFSVTPESIARHHASRCGGGVIIDCFTGVGGNAIQLAKRSNHVIAIDIDPQKIEYAQHNAAIYGVDERIDFMNGDFFQLAPELKAEVVFLSPPWGGPDYAKVQTYDIDTMLKPRDGYFLFNTSRGIASRIIMFLPRNVNLNQLAELSLSAHPPWALEVEKNYLNGKLKAITAYYTNTSA